MNAISMSVRQAADATGLSESAIRRAINGKEGDRNSLPAKYHGSKILILTSDLTTWIGSFQDVAQK